MMAPFEVFFDGDCPLCVREIAMLKRLDRRKAIQFTDITSIDFSVGSIGKDYETLMGSIHGKMADGSWVSGVEVFRQLYSAVGLAPVVAATRLPGVAWMLDQAYGVFARNRLAWTGRSGCETGTCKVGA